MLPDTQYWALTVLASGFPAVSGSSNDSAEEIRAVDPNN